MTERCSCGVRCCPCGSSSHFSQSVQGWGCLSCGWRQSAPDAVALASINRERQLAALGRAAP